MAEPRIAHALFCDQLRVEPTGRASFVGIYGGDLVLGIERRGTEFKFSTVAWLICDADDVPSRIVMRVYGPPGRRLLSGNEVAPQAPPKRADSTKAFFQLSLEDVVLPLSQEGDIEVSIETETGVLRAARVRLRFAASTAFLPASG